MSIDKKTATDEQRSDILPMRKPISGDLSTRRGREWHCCAYKRFGKKFMHPEDLGDNAAHLRPFSSPIQCPPAVDFDLVHCYKAAISGNLMAMLEP
jgi:hypothetical protein